MKKVDRGGDATWCPICGIMQDSNGVFHVPELVKHCFAACKEHSDSEYWGKSEKQIMKMERSRK